jgi:hypothetical protein
MALTVNNYTYPEHFLGDPQSDWFSLNIPRWNQLLSPYKNMDDLRFLELGTHTGRASVFLLDNILTGNNCFLDTVDIEAHQIVSDTGDILACAMSNLKPYIDKKTCEFHQKTTVDFFSTIGQTKYDLIYIDASHERDDVLFDAVNSFFHLKEYGVIIFDDYGWGECGQGIDAFLSIFSRKIKILVKEWQVVVQVSGS